MISKHSVKKPYTVVVGVALVIILGIVAFTKMTVDLLPNISLPYAIVITTYGGASPEQVETVVTRPVEQSMATISNIENVSSVSAENYSMVILEFAQSSNMDSVTIEMREKLDQIKGYWPDEVGSPIIMKLNPDMLPIMITAVGVEGMSAAEASEYVNDKIIPELESVEGVASVSAYGQVTESVEVTLLPEKIAALNDDAKKELDKKFKEAEDALKEAREQLDSAKEALDSGAEQAAAGIAEGASQIANGSAQLNAGLAEIAAKEAELNVNLTTIKTQLGTAQMLDAQIEQVETAIANKQNVQDGIDALELQISMLDPETQQAQIDILEQQKSMLEDTLAQIEAAEAALPDLQKSRAMIPMTTEELESTLAQLEAGLQQIQATKAELQAGAITLSEAQAQMASGQIEAASQLAAGQAQVAVGESQLNEKEEEFEKGKDDAYAAAAIDAILNKEMITTLLSAENFNMPAGYAVEDGIQYQVRVGERFDSAEALEDWVLVDLEDLGLGEIKLSDVAEVKHVDDSADSYAKLNGKSGILVSMEKQNSYSTNEVSERLTERMAELEEEYDGVSCVTLMDQGVYIRYVVNSVLKNMIMGAILAMLVLILFLRNWRPTAIIACAIPLSVLTAIVLMYFSGVTINIISLGGLALGIGMLVDNSIVVIENIYRLRGEGLPLKEAAIQGANQVAGAIAASTLTTVCVFLPIVFTEGITRQLFVDMGLTIGYSLVASLAVALTLVPMMAAGMLKRQPAKETKGWGALMRGYGKLLKGALKVRWLVLLVALGLTVGSAYLAFSRGMSYFPSMESPQMSVTLTCDDEDLTLQEVGEISDKAMEAMLTIPDITDVGAMAGGSSAGIGMLSSMMGGSDGTSVSMYLVLADKPELSNKEIADAILEKTADLPCTLDISAEAMDMSALGGSGISVEIRGRDIDKLEELAEKVGKILEADSGIAEVDNGLGETTGELRVIVNKEKAMSKNLTVAQVYAQIAARLSEVNSSGTLYTEDNEYEIYFYDENDTEMTRDDIKEMKITYTTTDGKEKKVKLSKIADFEDTQTLSSIRRDKQSRIITVSGKIAEDDNVTLVSGRVSKELEKLEVPKGYHVEMAGEDETIRDAMKQLGLMLVLAILFMYLIMVAQFQSLKSPFIVMFTIPLAFTGGFLALFLTGFDVSIIAMIGFIVLSGVIVNNGIVFVDYANQLVDGGKEINEALVETGKTRMRPIVMTAMTTILGLLTIAFAIGMGADIIQPMAIVTIGGLIYGTLLTLFVVPCVYRIFGRKARGDHEKGTGSEAAAEVPGIEVSDAEAVVKAVSAE